MIGEQNLFISMMKILKNIDNELFNIVLLYQYLSFLRSARTSNGNYKNKICIHWLRFACRMVLFVLKWISDKPLIKYMERERVIINYFIYFV